MSGPENKQEDNSLFALLNFFMPGQSEDGSGGMMQTMIGDMKNSIKNLFINSPMLGFFQKICDIVNKTAGTDISAAQIFGLEEKSPSPQVSGSALEAGVKNLVRSPAFEADPRAALANGLEALLEENGIPSDPKGISTIIDSLEDSDIESIRQDPSGFAKTFSGQWEGFLDKKGQEPDYRSDISPHPSGGEPSVDAIIGDPGTPADQEVNLNLGDEGPAWTWDMEEEGNVPQSSDVSQALPEPTVKVEAAGFSYGSAIEVGPASKIGLQESFTLNRMVEGNENWHMDLVRDNVTPSELFSTLGDDAALSTIEQDGSVIGYYIGDEEKGYSLGLEAVDLKAMDTGLKAQLYAAPDQAPEYEPGQTPVVAPVLG